MHSTLTSVCPAQCAQLDARQLYVPPKQQLLLGCDCCMPCYYLTLLLHAAIVGYPVFLGLIIVMGNARLAGLGLSTYITAGMLISAT